MRVLALALLGAALLLVPRAAAKPGRSARVLVRQGGLAAFIPLNELGRRIGIVAHDHGPLGISGDGRFGSIGGEISDGVAAPLMLPTKQIVWAPTGERAAYINTQYGVVEWRPGKGRRKIEPNGWGAEPWFGGLGLAWGPGNQLAVARRNEIWVIEPNGSSHRLLGPIAPNCCTGGPDIPVPFAWVGNHILWWEWPGSGSIASDGVSIYEDNTKLGTTLMYKDYVAVCGTHVALAQGIDRESMDDKSIVFDGRDVSNDRTHSWSTPACTAAGRLVASASRNLVPSNTTETHRAIWQLLPTRKQLTRPPWGWSDEDPRLYANGDMLFVRTRATFKKTATSYNATQTGHVMLLSHGKLTQLTTIGFTEDELSSAYPVEFYGHYDWSHNLAVWP
ncbi:MAG TPA: hypothetical protein VGL84_07950 [Gaiellaceae bacterium]